jgi:hypothetical protein
MSGFFSVSAENCPAATPHHGFSVEIEYDSGERGLSITATASTG